jgi:hypothetical protein
MTACGTYRRRKWKIDNGQLLGKDLQGGNCDSLEDNALEFSRKTKESHKETSVRTAGDYAYRQTCLLLNRYLKSYCCHSLLVISSGIRRVCLYLFAC